MTVEAGDGIVLYANGQEAFGAILCTFTRPETFGEGALIRFQSGLLAEVPIEMVAKGKELAERFESRGSAKILPFPRTR